MLISTKILYRRNKPIQKQLFSNKTCLLLLRVSLKAFKILYLLHDIGKLLNVNDKLRTHHQRQKGTLWPIFPIMLLHFHTYKTTYV